eukprot:TRINITY_DN7990_c0_g1_i12.p2 TRINITY_DN7990_c0_g1~~TRINITY_DN7990_c0_g1_i12.p2  ORF type:complete len:138 (+),score=21.64 TRINITY_DN7990_c0_g1_i12:147-560(+)
MLLTSAIAAIAGTGAVGLGAKFAFLGGPATWDRVKRGKVPSYFTQGVLWVCGVPCCLLGGRSLLGITTNSPEMVGGLGWCLVWCPCVLLVHTVVELGWGNPHFGAEQVVRDLCLLLVGVYCKCVMDALADHELQLGL